MIRRSDRQARTGARRQARGKGFPGGFTLIELVISLGLIGLALTTILYLRIEAVDRAAEYNLNRILTRIAREKLEQVVNRIEEYYEGTFEEYPDWQWTVDTSDFEYVGETIILKYKITVYYRMKEEDKTYELSYWFFPDDWWYEENWDLFDENGRYSPEGTWGYDEYGSNALYR